MVELSNRLQTIASLVKTGSRIADIGTDHGFLPIYLAQAGVITHAVAMDIRKGPLARAEEHVGAYGLTEMIETRLSDGLEKLNAGEADTVIIAGMGGPLILEILSRGMAVVPSVKQFILSPQSDWNGFRKGLKKMGFIQLNEDMVCEDGKYYLITEVKYAPEEAKHREAQGLEDRFGPFLMKDKHPELRRYLEWQLGIYRGILHKLAEGSAKNAEERELEVKEELAFVEAALRLF